MRKIRVDVKNKIATYNTRDGVIVCGNKGYTITFTFDEEWNECTTKTARFIWNGRYYDKEFTGDECSVPVINDATNVTVGVYAGDLKTTTPANIPCLISILCGNPKVIEENIKEYRDIAQEAAATAQQAAEEAVRAAGVVVNPTIDVEEIEGGHRITIHDADGDESFDVMGGGLTSEQLTQFNTLVEWHKNSTYKNMSVTIRVSPSTMFEIGSTQDVTISWAFSNEVSSVTFNGEDIKPASKTGSKRVTGITKNSSYQVIGTRADGDKEDAKTTANVSFYNKYYFGCTTQAETPQNIDYNFIGNKINIVKSDFATSKPSFSEEVEINSDTKQYIWLAYPNKFRTSNFAMNGFDGGFNDVQTVTFTNQYGVEEKYYVYRSVEAGTGKIKVLVD